MPSTEKIRLCTRCYTENSLHAHYCMRCGAGIWRPDQASRTGATCVCGAKNEPRAAHCRACGKVLSPAQRGVNPRDPMRGTWSRHKEQEIRNARPEIHDLHEEFWVGLLRLANQKTRRHARISPSKQSWIGASAGVAGFRFNYIIRQYDGRVEVYIDRRDVRKEINKQLFDALIKSKSAIEREFGGTLSWERLDHRRGCRICYRFRAGGIKTEKAQWPVLQGHMVDAMIRLEKALMPHLAKLNSGP